MKTKNPKPSPAFGFPVALATQAFVIALASIATAADGTWTQTTTGGSWSTTGNWSGGTIADGSGFAANFNTLDITTDDTVHLDGDRTLTSLTFGDTSPGSAAGWLIDNNGTSTNNLILAGTTPTITVNPLGTGKAVEISAVIEGSAGLRKLGAGTLVLSGQNTFTGDVAINSTSGAVIVTNSSSLGTGPKNVSVQNAASTLKLDGSGGDISFASNITFNTSGNQSGGDFVNIAGNNTINGAFNLNSGGTPAGTSVAVDSGALTIAGNITVTGGSGIHILTLMGAGNGTISGNVSNGSRNTAITKSGVGTWTLSGNNSFTEGLKVLAGGLIARNSGNALGGSGTGAVTLGNTSGSDTVTLALATSSTFNNPITVASGSSGSATITNYSNYSPTLAGSIALNKSLVLANTNLSGGNDLTVSGTVGGNGGLNIESTHANNTVTFAGTGNQTGSTSVTGGTLAINGSFTSALNTVAVGSGTTLKGNGSIAGDVNVSGQIAPGNSIESLGTGNISFLTGSAFAYELDSVALDGDLIASTGTLDIASGSVLSFNQIADAVLANGAKLTLISYFGGWVSTELFKDSLGGTILDGSTFTIGSNQWLFDYDDLAGGSNFTTDQAGASRFVTMTVVPEPGPALLASMGMFALLRRRRAHTP